MRQHDCVPKLALPATWPRVVRSAVVHAVSLAHWSIVRARGWAANSPLERVRLRAHNERLRSEVALLQEELRIKDERLGKITPSITAPLSWPRSRERDSRRACWFIRMTAPRCG